MDVNPEMSPALGLADRLVTAKVGVYPRERIAERLEHVAFYGLLGTVALAAIPYGGVQPWWVAAITCLVFVLVSLRIVEATLRRDWRISGAAMVIPLLALCLFAGFQTFPLEQLKLNTIETGNVWRTISTDPLETKRFIFRFLAAVLCGESLLRYSSTRQRLRTVVAAVIGIGVLSAAFGIVRQIGQTDAQSFILPNLGLAQGYGQFINRNHFAFLMEMCLGVLLGLVIGKGEARNKFFPLLSMALLVWIALVLTNSRGGIISMLGLILCAAMTHLAITRWSSNNRRGSHYRSWFARYGSTVATTVALGVSLIVITAVGVSWVGGDPVVARLETVSGELSSGEADHVARKQI